MKTEGLDSNVARNRPVILARSKEENRGANIEPERKVTYAS